MLNKKEYVQIMNENNLAIQQTFLGVMGYLYDRAVDSKVHKGLRNKLLYNLAIQYALTIREACFLAYLKLYPLEENNGDGDGGDKEKKYKNIADNKYLTNLYGDAKTTKGNLNKLITTDLKLISEATREEQLVDKFKDIIEALPLFVKYDEYKNELYSDDNLTDSVINKECFDFIEANYKFKPVLDALEEYENSKNLANLKPIVKAFLDSFADVNLEPVLKFIDSFIPEYENNFSLFKEADKDKFYTELTKSDKLIKLTDINIQIHDGTYTESFILDYLSDYFNEDVNILDLSDNHIAINEVRVLKNIANAIKNKKDRILNNKVLGKKDKTSGVVNDQSNTRTGKAAGILKDGKMPLLISEVLTEKVGTINGRNFGDVTYKQLFDQALEEFGEQYVELVMELLNYVRLEIIIYEGQSLIKSYKQRIGDDPKKNARLEETQRMYDVSIRNVYDLFRTYIDVQKVDKKVKEFYSIKDSGKEAIDSYNKSNDPTLLQDVFKCKLIPGCRTIEKNKLYIMDTRFYDKASSSSVKAYVLLSSMENKIIRTGDITSKQFMLKLHGIYSIKDNKKVDYNDALLNFNSKATDTLNKSGDNNIIFYGIDNFIVSNSGGKHTALFMTFKAPFKYFTVKKEVDINGAKQEHNNIKTKNTYTVAEQQGRDKIKDELKKENVLKSYNFVAAYEVLLDELLNNNIFDNAIKDAEINAIKSGNTYTSTHRDAIDGITEVYHDIFTPLEFITPNANANANPAPTNNPNPNPNPSGNGNGGGNNTAPANNPNPNP